MLIIGSAHSLISSKRLSEPLRPKKVCKLTVNDIQQLQIKQQAEDFFQREKEKGNLEKVIRIKGGFKSITLTSDLENILKLDHYLIKDQFFLPILPAAFNVYQIIDQVFVFFN